MNKEMTTSKFSEIKRRFQLQKESRKELGDYINLCYVIKGRNYNKKDLRKAFLNLINRDEYLFSEREEYISYLSTI
jgi:hypothetical protein